MYLGAVPASARGGFHVDLSDSEKAEDVTPRFYEATLALPRAQENKAHDSSESHSEFIGTRFTVKAGPRLEKGVLTDVKAIPPGVSLAEAVDPPLLCSPRPRRAHPPYGVSFLVFGQGIVGVYIRQALQGKSATSNPYTEGQPCDIKKTRPEALFPPS